MSSELSKICENFSRSNALFHVRTFWLILSLSMVLGQAPPTKRDYQERRAAILRQMAEVKAKLAALDVELQLLEEARPAEAPPPSPTAWREEPAGASADGKKATPRCLSVTRDGKRCTRPSEPGAKYCWQHRNH